MESPKEGRTMPTIPPDALNSAISASPPGSQEKPEAERSKAATQGRKQSHTSAVRALINIGVFAVIYLIVMFVTSTLGFLGPHFSFIGWALGVPLNGIVIMLLLARVKGFGALSIIGALTMLTMLSSGSLYASIILLLAVLGDLIQSKGARARNYNPRLAPLGYAVFSLWLVMPFWVISSGTGTYVETIRQSRGQEYLDAVTAFYQPWILVIWAVLLFALGYLGGYLGNRALQRHFYRAGAIA